MRVCVNRDATKKVTLARKIPSLGGGKLRVLAGPIYAHMLHFPVTSECCIGQRPKLLMSMTEGLKRHH